jgi:hypothetical protein
LKIETSRYQFFLIHAFDDEANDFRFSPRCFDNQQARDLANAALSGSSTDIARLLSSNGSANHGAVSETNKAKSMLLANIAQAKIQLKDSTGAIRACNEALKFDPTNMKVTELSLYRFQFDIFFMICQSFFFCSPFYHTKSTPLSHTGPGSKRIGP